MVKYQYLIWLHILKDFHEKKDRFVVTENIEKMIEENIELDINHELNRINSIDIRT
jgi:hypothetical protein